MAARSRVAKWSPLRVSALAVLVAACVEGGEPLAAPPAPPPERLVRPGAVVVERVPADLDGDGVAEVAISSVSSEADDLGFATPYLEIFDVREGAWTRVFDATGSAPPGAGAPPEMLARGAGFVGQSVEALAATDFAGDGRPELVVGILSFGATAGPLELWIVSMAHDGELSTELYRSSTRGGAIRIDHDRVRFEYGVYRKADPGCCPSLTATETIGWDPAGGGIEVLSRRRTRNR